PIPTAYAAGAGAPLGPGPAAAPAAPTHVSGKPSGYPPQPVFPGPQHPPVRNNPAPPPRGAYAPQSAQSAYRPPQQRVIHPPQPQSQQRPVVGPQPLRQAPRQPRPVSAYEPKSGIGCLGKIAILLIVLALAALIGVKIGDRIARNHTSGNSSGVSIIVPWNGFRGSSH
ncbi:hypothetical protein KDL01_37800, partial [Actinospica durhamensis]|nr:hypothetical protein [Actinospica durhamensis]